MGDLASKRAVADAYYAEGCDLVEAATVSWDRAHDPAVPADFRAVARHAYAITAARARTRFHRHDVLLDAIARAEAT